MIIVPFIIITYFLNNCTHFLNIFLIISEQMRNKRSPRFRISAMLLSAIFSFAGSHMHDISLLSTKI